MKYFGLRILKTGLTVFLAALLADLISPGEGFVIIFTSIVALDSTINDSLRGGIKRLLNTAVGALIAVIMIYSGLPMELTIPLSTMALIVVSNKLGLKGSIGISGAVLIIILLAKDKNPLLYSLVRLRDTGVGITTAVLVNLFIFPPKLYKRLKEKGVLLLDETYATINEVFHYRMASDIDSYKLKVENFSKELIKVKEEFAFKKSISNKNLLLYRQIISSFEKLKVFIENLSLMEEGIGVTRENQDKLDSILKLEHISGIKIIEEAKSKEEILYNFLLEKILKNLNLLEELFKELEDKE